MIVPIAIAAALGLAAVASRGANTGSAGDRPEVAARPNPAGLAALRVYATTAGLSKDWQDFFAIVAYGESRGHNDVGLGVTAGAPPWAAMNRSKAEASAAAKRYAAHADKYRRCWERAFYTFGSGGWFAMLPASALAVFNGTALECLHPWAVFDPAPSLVMAMGYADRLMGWEGYADEPTFLNLRVGWGNPSSMGDAKVIAAKRKKFSDHAQAIGLPPSVLDRRPSRLDFDAVRLFDFLGGDRGWLPAGPVAIGAPANGAPKPVLKEAA